MRYAKSSQFPKTVFKDESCIPMNRTGGKVLYIGLVAVTPSMSRISATLRDHDLVEDDEVA